MVQTGDAPVAGRIDEILLLRYAEGSASTADRERGFLDRLKEKWPGLVLVSSDQYAGATRDTAKRASENLLNRFGRDIQGLFAVNESAASGMLLALQDAGLAGKVKFIGFDSNQTFVDAMRKGEMQAFVLQNPFKMSGLAVETLIDHLDRLGFTTLDGEAPAVGVRPLGAAA